MTEITDISKNKLKEYLNQDDFYTKLRQNDKELVNFFLDNINLLIDFVFEDQTIDYRTINKCISFLVTRDTKVHNKLLQETKLTDFLANYPLKFKQIDHGLRIRYRDILEAFLLPEPNRFNKNVGNNQLFTNLISVCDYNSSFEMLQKIISEEDQKVIYHLLTIHFIDIVAKYVIGGKILNFNSQKIIIQLIDRGCENFVAESLTKDAFLLTFINSAIKTPKVWKNFRFIEKIYKYSINYTKNSNWKTIEITISSFLEDFRKIIMATDTWCDTANTCVSIIEDILNFHNKINEKDILLFKFLIDKFFSTPQCSILHLAVLKYFTLFHKLGKLDLKILNETHLITNIIDCYKKREQLPLCNYFGQLREMSILITPLVDKENNDNWNSIVVKKNKEIYKLINGNTNNLTFKCQKKNIFSMQKKFIPYILSISIIIFVFLVYILKKL